MTFYSQTGPAPERAPGPIIHYGPDIQLSDDVKARIKAAVDEWRAGTGKSIILPEGVRIQWPGELPLWRGEAIVSELKSTLDFLPLALTGAFGGAAGAFLFWFLTTVLS